MANFGTFRYTTNGINLELKAQLGKELQFTKFVLGDGYYTGNIRDLTSVVNQIREEDITRLNIQTTTDTETGTTRKKVQIGFTLDTADVQTGFYLREIALYAKDPDTNQELLAVYGNAGDTADYIAPAGSSTITQKLQSINLYVNDTDNITAVIDTSIIYATQDELEQLEANINADFAKIQVKPFTIAASAWTQNITTELYEAIISDTSINSYDSADVCFDSNTYNIAAIAGVKGYTTEIQSTGIKLFADSVPEGTVSGKYMVNRGVANGQN